MVGNKKRNEDMKILITGGLGFIGYNIARKLIEEGYDIILFDNNFRNVYKQSQIDNRMSFVFGDTSDYFVLQNIFKGGLIIHCASITGIKTVDKYPIDTLYKGIEGAYNICKLADETGSKVILTSSAEIFGEENNKIPDEIDRYTIRKSKRWSYALSKITAEYFAYLFNLNNNLDIIVVRPFNIYGKDQNIDSAIIKFIDCAITNKPIPIFKPGTQVRAWCYIDDYVDAIRLLIDKGESGKCYSVGNPKEPTNLINLGNIISNLVGCNYNYTLLDYNDIDPQYRVPNISLLSDLGFTPKVTLEKGIKEIINYRLNLYNKQI